MSVFLGGAARRPTPLQRGPVLALALMLPLVATLVLRVASTAEPNVTPVRLDAGQAQRAELAVEMVAHPQLPVPLIELRAAGSRSLGAVLDAAPDGSSVVLAERLGQDPTTLVIAGADGSQLRIPISGLLSAAFAPDGSWLAVVDGLGRLWRIDAGSGHSELVAEGPFAGPTVVEAAGSILALAVSSVEAPFISRLYRLQPSTGAADQLSDEELVYAASPLDDGSLAVIAHRPSGTVVRRIEDGRSSTLADLGPGAVNVSVASGGGVLAWERDGEIQLRVGAAEVRSVGPGTRPRLTPDGAAVLVDRGAGAALIAVDGTQLARFSGPAVLLRCGACLP